MPSPNFDYKLAWFERLVRYAATLVDSPRPIVLAGDFNVVPTKADIYDEWPWRFDAVVQPGTRALHPKERIYAFWVNADAYRRNAGFRMDFLLLNPALAQALRAAEVDHAHRDREKPSDHAPVWIDVAIDPSS